MTSIAWWAAPGAVMGASALIEGAGASALMDGLMAAKGSIISGTAGSASAGSSGVPCCSLRPCVKPWKEWVRACDIAHM